MLRKVLAMAAGVTLTIVGLIGLVIPVLPGVVLLVAAAGCFSLVSRRFRTRLERRLDRHPRYRRALRRWRCGSTLPLLARLRLAFWLTLSSVVPERQR